MKKLFTVASYRRIENWIEVDVQNIVTSIDEKELEIEIKVPARKFWDFIIFNDKANWELNLEVGGEHVQTTGAMDEEEYFLLDQDTVLDDLYEFIISNPIRFRNQVKIDSINSILSQFNSF